MPYKLSLGVAAIDDYLVQHMIMYPSGLFGLFNVSGYALSVGLLG